MDISQIDFGPTHVLALHLDETITVIHDEVIGADSVKGIETRNPGS